MNLPLLVVIDDDPFFCAQIQLFAKSTFDVLQYNSPEEVEAEALDAADLIVLDLQMPGQDGIEFVRALALICPNKPLVIISGSDKRLISMAGKVARMFGMSNVRSLQKPLQYGTFRDLARQLSSEDCMPVSSLSNQPRDPLVTAEVSQKSSMQPLYLPRINIKTYDVSGFDAFTSPRYGSVSESRGDSTVGIADSYQEATVVMNLALLEKAMQVYKINARWLGNHCRLSVTLESDLIIDTKLLNELTTVIRRMEFLASKVIFSLSGKSLVGNNREVCAGLARLKLKGYQLSVRQVDETIMADPGVVMEICDELVIDKRLTRQLTSSLSARSLIESILRLGTRSGLRVVADGVDNERTLSWLRQLGEPAVQGRLFSAPLGDADFAHWVKNWAQSTI